jgi:hypothetical protein
VLRSRRAVYLLRRARPAVTYAPPGGRGHRPLQWVDDQAPRPGLGRRPWRGAALARQRDGSGAGAEFAAAAEAAAWRRDQRTPTMAASSSGVGAPRTTRNIGSSDISLAPFSPSCSGDRCCPRTCTELGVKIAPAAAKFRTFARCAVRGARGAWRRAVRGAERGGAPEQRRTTTAECSRASSAGGCPACCARVAAPERSASASRTAGSPSPRSHARPPRTGWRRRPRTPR